MTYIKKRKVKSMLTLLLAIIAFGVASCEKTKSYSEMLRDEEKAVNAYLAQQKVLLDIPADSISFEMGADAPFYRIDLEGNVYMQVLNKGDLNDKPKAGDVVYFRYSRTNLLSLYNGESSSDAGNSDNLGIQNTYFIFENMSLRPSVEWGTGVQMPLRYFGYGSEVNLILKSYCGWSADQSMCQPYVINMRYFKPEY